MREIRPHRAVSSRSLARDTARLLDEIDDTDSALAIVRFGRIVAVLAPFKDGERIGVEELVHAERSIDDFQLRDLDRKILGLIGAEPTGAWSPDQRPMDLATPEVLGSLTRLELAGLIERGVGRFRLTKLGRSVRR